MRDDVERNREETEDERIQGARYALVAAQARDEMRPQLALAVAQANRYRAALQQIERVEASRGKRASAVILAACRTALTQGE